MLKLRDWPDDVTCGGKKSHKTDQTEIEPDISTREEPDWV